MMAGKKIKGRKRQIVVDSQGNVYGVLVHEANMHDSKGGAILIDLVLKELSSVAGISADLGYRGFFEKVVTDVYGKMMLFSSKIAGKFVLQPIRWVVERTIAWLNWARRLCKDFEQKCIYSENVVRLAAIRMTLKQIH